MKATNRSTVSFRNGVATVLWPHPFLCTSSQTSSQTTFAFLAMPVFVCAVCKDKHAAIKRPKTGDALCRECFFQAFEAEVHRTIVSNRLFSRGELIGVAASGGKDSTVLAYVLKRLNEQYDYGLKLVLLSVDEGITGYRDDSLEGVK